MKALPRHPGPAAGPHCDANPPAGVVWYCTRPKGHQGMHVASNGVITLAIWDDSIALTTDKSCEKEYRWYLPVEEVVTTTKWVTQ